MLAAGGGGPAAAGVLQHGGGWGGCRGTSRSRSDPATGGQGCSLEVRVGPGCDAKEMTTFFNLTRNTLLYLQPVFRIHAVLVWIRIRVSMPLTNGFRSCYFRHWPSRCQQKTNYFNKDILLITFWRYIYTIFKDKKSKRSHKPVGFLNIFAAWLKDLDPDPDPDPYFLLTDTDPGGPKTCGSGGSGSGTLPTALYVKNTYFAGFISNVNGFIRRQMLHMTYGGFNDLATSSLNLLFTFPLPIQLWGPLSLQFIQLCCSSWYLVSNSIVQFALHLLNSMFFTLPPPIQLCCSLCRHLFNSAVPRGGHRHLQIGRMHDIDLISEPPHAPSPQIYVPKVWESVWPVG